MRTKLYANNTERYNKKISQTHITVESNIFVILLFWNSVVKDIFVTLKTPNWCII